jgi:diguanylate cyclase (GGDEF)-like protein
MASKLMQGWTRWRDWVLAQPAQRPLSAADIQLSALRLVLLASLALAAVVGLHVAWEGWQRDKPWAVAIVGAIVLLLAGAASQTRRAGRAGALWLLVAIYLAGFAITASTGSQPALSRLGYVLCYAAPMLAGLLVAWPLALGLMLFNTLLFGLSLSGWEAPQLPDQQVRLPLSQAYVHGALYLFFNLCLPLAMFRVVAGMRRVERKLRGWRHLSEQVFHVASGPTLVCDDHGRVLRCNKPFLALCGYHKEQELRGRSLAELFEDAEGGDGAWRSQPGLRWRLAERLATRGGSRELTLRSVRSLGHRLCAYAFDDVTELRRVQADLAASVRREAWATWHDPLTGLPNRARCIQQLDAQLSQGTPGLALLSLRLCNLRQLNARYGVPAGDALLRDFVAALRRLLPPGAQAARVRGSVIAVLLPGQRGEREALAEVQRLRRALPLQAETARQAVLLDLACGLVLAEELRAQHPEADGAELLRCSELALDMAQDPRWREGSEGLLLFNAQTAQGMARSMAIEAELPQALAGDQLHLLYQPQRDVRGGLLGFEVLVRWNSPALGAVPPAEFIPVAEACGLVGGITDWVLDAACAQLAQWRRELDPGLPLPRLAVNLSAHDLEREGFEQQLMHCLARHRVRPAELELEVTESALARHPARALAQLRRLHGAGLRIAIDDFGTGYSSLAKLVDLPIDVLKIDRSFLRDLPGDARRERVVDSMISLARSLRLEVLAEGVETEDQHHYLRALGVHGLQGWLFGRPRPAAHWLPLLRREGAAQPEPA